VDPMPDQDEEKDWLLAFGEVDDAFRITDPETGEAGDRGYVRFVDHVAAERCVESGAAEWSESERVLMSQSSRGSTSVYRESVIALILGPRGETINKVKDSIGASMLALRGDGLNGNSSTKSDRLHFVCKGTGEVVSKLQPALEEMMASIHVQIVERLADTTDRTFASGSEAGPAPKTRRSRGALACSSTAHALLVLGRRSAAFVRAVAGSPLAWSISAFFLCLSRRLWALRATECRWSPFWHGSGVAIDCEEHLTSGSILAPGGGHGCAQRKTPQGLCAEALAKSGGGGD